jgi:hypothetical protein
LDSNVAHRQLFSEFFSGLLEDPGNEKEIFASEVAGIAMVHNNFVLTLANVRFEETIGNKPARARRIVVGRVALTSATTAQLVQSLQRFTAQLEAASKPAPTATAN